MFCVSNKLLETNLLQLQVVFDEVEDEKICREYCDNE